MISQHQVVQQELMGMIRMQATFRIESDRQDSGEAVKKALENNPNGPSCKAEVVPVEGRREPTLALPSGTKLEGLGLILREVREAASAIAKASSSAST